MGPLIVDAIVVSACGGRVMAAPGSYIATTFGASSFSRTFGVLGLFTLPFMFGMPPLTSYLYTLSRSYWLPVSVVVASFLASAAMIAAISPAERRAWYRIQPNDATSIAGPSQSGLGQRPNEPKAEHARRHVVRFFP
jgi:hypothetical protein